MADFDEAKERLAFESAMRSEGAKDWEFHRLIPQMDSFKRVAHVGRYVMDRTEYKWNGWQLARHQPSAPAWITIKTALEVMVRDYKAVHGIGDMEMQPALEQAARALEEE